MARRYVGTLAAWLVGGLLAPVALTVALVLAVNAVCEGASDCSWGFEFILVIPVLLACFFWIGPRRVGRFWDRLVDPRLRRLAARATRLGALISLVLLYAGAGAGAEGFSLMLVVVAFGVPALVVVRLAEE